MNSSWLVLLRGVAVATLFVVGFEGVARRGGHFDPSTREDPYLGFPGTSRLFQPRVASDGSAIYETAQNKKKIYRVQSFPAAKAPGEFRVFCIGGSGVRSDAFMDPDGSFPFMLWVYLRDAMPDRMVRVLNCGGGGMGSVQNLEVLREIVDYEPDLIVVCPEGGEKNMVPPSPQGMLAVADDASPLRVAARRLLTKLRLYHVLRDGYQRCFAPGKASQFELSAFSAFIAAIVGRTFEPDIFTRFLEFKVDRVPVVMEESPIPKDVIDVAHARFRRNLATMATLAREQSIPLCFLVPLRNLRSSFYLRFHIRSDEIAGGKVEEWRAAYERALEAKRAGRYEEAIAGLSAVRAMYVHDDDSILAYYLGECFEKLGRRDEALAEFEKTYLRHPMRAQIAQVAGEQNVPVVDTYREVVAIASDGIPGYDEFTDSVHPMPKTNRVFARAIYRDIIQPRLQDLPKLDDPKLVTADQLVVRLCERLPGTVANRMLDAMLSGDYQRAVGFAQALKEDDLMMRSIEPLYLGWALTKQGRTAEARELFLKLKAKYGGQLNLRRASKLDQSEDMIRYAFSNDIFHWF
jgi:tetratricopeptide (TPR) repeat protein